MATGGGWGGVGAVECVHVHMWAGRQATQPPSPQLGPCARPFPCVEAAQGAWGGRPSRLSHTHARGHAPATASMRGGAASGASLSVACVRCSPRSIPRSGLGDRAARRLQLVLGVGVVRLDCVGRRVKECTRVHGSKNLLGGKKCRGGAQGTRDEIGARIDKYERGQLSDLLAWPTAAAPDNRSNRPRPRALGRVPDHIALAARAPRTCRVEQSDVRSPWIDPSVREAAP